MFLGVVCRFCFGVSFGRFHFSASEFRRGFWAPPRRFSRRMNLDFHSFFSGSLFPWLVLLSLQLFVFPIKTWPFLRAVSLCTSVLFAPRRKNIIHLAATNCKPLCRWTIFMLSGQSGATHFHSVRSSHSTTPLDWNSEVEGDRLVTSVFFHCSESSGIPAHRDWKSVTGRQMPSFYFSRQTAPRLYGYANNVSFGASQTGILSCGYGSKTVTHLMRQQHACLLAESVSKWLCERERRASFYCCLNVIWLGYIYGNW